jgi:transcriptional/translational regulatory protein YebC/TACO1
MTDNRNRTVAEIRHIFSEERRQSRRIGFGWLDV